MRVYLQGEFVAAEKARVSAFDRGFVMGDGVYEGLRACEGVIVGLGAHVERMRAGLAETRIEGFEAGDLGTLSEALLDANGLREAFVYWQVTRGAPSRFEDPTALRTRSPSARAGFAPTVFGFCHALPGLETYVEPASRSASVLPDLRWHRGHIKSISLMGSVLASVEAAEEGADDAILVRDGVVAEGTATNVVISKGGRLATPPVRGGAILCGVTRKLILEEEPSIEVRDISEEELRTADEVMLIGTLTMVASVTRLDGKPVGAGKVGPASRSLLETLVRAIRKDVAAASARV